MVKSDLESEARSEECSVLPKGGQDTVILEAKGKNSLLDKAGEFIDRHLRLFKVMSNVQPVSVLMSG